MVTRVYVLKLNGLCHIIQLVSIPYQLWNTCAYNYASSVGKFLSAGVTLILLKIGETLQIKIEVPSGSVNNHFVVWTSHIRIFHLVISWSDVDVIFTAFSVYGFSFVNKFPFTVLMSIQIDPFVSVFIECVTANLASFPLLFCIEFFFFLLGGRLRSGSLGRFACCLSGICFRVIFFFGLDFLVFLLLFFYYFFFFIIIISPFGCCSPFSFLLGCELFYLCPFIVFITYVYA